MSESQHFSEVFPKMRPSFAPLLTISIAANSLTLLATSSSREKLNLGKKHIVQLIVKDDRPLQRQKSHLQFKTFAILAKFHSTILVIDAVEFCLSSRCRLDCFGKHPMSIVHCTCQAHVMGRRTNSKAIDRSSYSNHSMLIAHWAHIWT